MHKNALNL